MNYEKSKRNFCNPLFGRLASVTGNGVSNFSDVVEIPATSPDIAQNLTVHSMEYIVSDVSFVLQPRERDGSAENLSFY